MGRPFSSSSAWTGGAERRLSAVLHLPATANGYRRLLWRWPAAVRLKHPSHVRQRWQLRETRVCCAAPPALLFSPNIHLQRLHDRRTLVLQDMLIGSYGGCISGEVWGRGHVGTPLVVILLSQKNILDCCFFHPTYLIKRSAISKETSIAIINMKRISVCWYSPMAMWVFFGGGGGRRAVNCCRASGS